MILMELCSHGALREGLRFPLNWQLRVRLALDTALGLAYLHENNIIHRYKTYLKIVWFNDIHIFTISISIFFCRDIKTTNVLIDSEWRAKLCDFSFACHTECSAKRDFTYGTDEFMSPEIALCEDFGVSSDIFSFGILLCEVVSGQVCTCTPVRCFITILLPTAVVLVLPLSPQYPVHHFTRTYNYFLLYNIWIQLLSIIQFLNTTII